jgi:dolichyl-phosphate-mannose-protein mannosyltransferase
VSWREVTRPAPGLAAVDRLAALDRFYLFGGLALFLIGLVLDWSLLVGLTGLPVDQQRGIWLQGEMTNARVWCLFTGALLMTAGVVSRYASLAARWCDALRKPAVAIESGRVLVPAVLIALVVAKSAIEIAIYAKGYAAYGADDFARSLSADYVFHHSAPAHAGDGWVGFAGSPWLPFPDYLYGLGLMIHRDLYLTPRFQNLIISAVAVAAAFFLGRELFGRVAGVLTAALVALQPWHEWLGFSGMTSDLPSIVLITLFATLMFRWFEDDQPRTLVSAAGSLGIATGFRHESWCLAAAFSAVLAFITISRLRQRRLTRQWLTGTVCALVMMTAFPVAWTTHSFLTQGDFLPHLSWSQWRGPSPSGAAMPDPEASSSGMGNMNLLLLAGGAFPLEIALSIAGIIWALKSTRARSHLQYLGVLAIAMLGFAIGFKGRLAASIVFARYLVPFIVMLLPYAGGWLASLLRPTPVLARQRAAVLGAVVIVLSVGMFDVLRTFNYPAQFPGDALSAGWTLRQLQENGAVPAEAKILIERAEDWGDLGIVTLAGHPERFVVLNELAYRQAALAHRSANRPAPIPKRPEDGVRGTVCEEDFAAEPCRKSVLDERFDLVILSSPRRIESFRKSFPGGARVVGRYYIFNLKADRTPSSAEPGQDSRPDGAFTIAR